MEAVFRAGLIHVRENVEALAVSRREAVSSRPPASVTSIGTGGELIIAVSRNLGFFTSGIGQVNRSFRRWSSRRSLFAAQWSSGSITQTAMAYGQLSGRSPCSSRVPDRHFSCASRAARVSFTDAIDSTRAQSAAGPDPRSGRTTRKRDSARPCAPASRRRADRQVSSLPCGGRALSGRRGRRLLQDGAVSRHCRDLEVRQRTRRSIRAPTR